MKLLDWTTNQSKLVLAAMKQVSTEGGRVEMSEVDRLLLGCLQEHVLHTDFDIDALPAVEPQALAAALASSDHRMQAVDFLTFAVYSATEMNRQRADVAQAFADGLEVHSDATHYLRQMRDHQMWRLKLDYVRAQLRGNFLPAASLREKLAAVLRVLEQQRGDETVARRFRELEKLPDGTLGKAFFQFYRLRGYPLPGEPRCIPEDIIAVHDLSHILTGFNTDRAGEIAVVTCQAGYMKKHPYEMILDGLTSFNMGIMLDVQLDIKPAKGYLDPHLMMVGLERGMTMTVDLMDGWDYWAAMGERVAELRQRYGISGAEDVWLQPPPPEPDDKRVAQ